MQEKSAAGFYIEIVVYILILGTLMAIAIPNVGKLLDTGKVEASNAELRNIQTAIIGMLAESEAGLLLPAGPTSDMSLVMTEDTPPLVLEDYLLGLPDGELRSGSAYIFEADGTVRRVSP